MGLSQDANGWTLITPTAGWQNGFNTGAPSTSETMIIFVSSLTGSDSTSSTEGSFANPYATIAKALTRTGGTSNGGRANSPDWILLATGETWTEIGPAFFGPGLNQQNPMIFSSYDKTATVSVPSSPPIPDPYTGTVARPIIKASVAATDAILDLITNTAVMGIDLYAYTRDTVTNPANAGNPNVGDGIKMTSLSNSNILMEDNLIRWYNNGITCDMSPTNGPVSIRRNIVLNCWGDKFGIGSFAVSPSFLIEENFVYHCGWDAVGQPDGSSLNHNLYISGNNQGPGSGPEIALSDLYFHGNISCNDLFQTNNRCGGHLNNNLWQLGGNGGTNFGPNNPAIANLVENEVSIGGFLGGVGHTASADNALELQAPFGPDGFGGFYGNGVPGIQHVYVTGCIVTQGFGTATGGLTIVGTGDGAWTNLVTVTNCISYKFSGTVVYNAIETVINGGGNLGTNSPSQAAINGWLHPERTPETYMSEVIHDGSTWADFIRRCSLQSKRNWNPLLMAESVNDYIRQGFNMPFVGSAYADTQGTIVLMGQACL